MLVWLYGLSRLLSADLDMVYRLWRIGLFDFEFAKLVCMVDACGIELFLAFPQKTIQQYRRRVSHIRLRQKTIASATSKPYSHITN